MRAGTNERRCTRDISSLDGPEDVKARMIAMRRPRSGRTGVSRVPDGREKDAVSDDTREVDRARSLHIHVR
jgi:hypothetical protein